MRPFGEGLFEAVAIAVFQALVAEAGGELTKDPRELRRQAMQRTTTDPWIYAAVSRACSEIMTDLRERFTL